MNEIEKIIKLHEAGFSADEIAQIYGAVVSISKAPAEAPEKPAEAPEDAKPINISTSAEKPAKTANKSVEAEAPEADHIDELNQRIDKLAGVVDKLSKLPLFPSMEEVEPLGIDDIISNFFKEE